MRYDLAEKLKNQRFSVLAVLLLSPLSLLGCNPPDASTTNPPPPENGAPADAEAEVAADFERVRKEIDEALAAAAEYSSRQKDEYVDDLKRRLNELDVSFEELRKEARDLSADAKREWQDELDATRDQREKLRKQLEELSAASGDAWQHLSRGFEEAWRELKASVDQAAESEAP